MLFRIMRIWSCQVIKWWELCKIGIPTEKPTMKSPLTQMETESQTLSDMSSQRVRLIKVSISIFIHSMRGARKCRQGNKKAKTEPLWINLKACKISGSSSPRKTFATLNIITSAYRSSLSSTMSHSSRVRIRNFRSNARFSTKKLVEAITSPRRAAASNILKGQTCKLSTQINLTINCR